MTAQELPAPLVDANVDLRGYEFMPFFGDRLFGSETWMECNPEAKVAALRLWWRAYAHEVPAGSLPAKDVLICQYAGYEANPRAWARLKPSAMRGWVLCSDGRLYHPFVAELATEAFVRRLEQRNRTEKARNARLSKILSQKENSPPNPSVTDSVGSLLQSPQDRTGQDRTENLSSTEVSARTPPPKASAAKATRLPADWVLPRAWGEWALSEQATWTATEVRKCADRFRDHWLAAGGQNARKVDWEATWRNWVRREPAKGVKNGKPSIHEQRAATLAAFAAKPVERDITADSELVG